MGRILKDVPTDADLRDVFTGESLARGEESQQIISQSEEICHFLLQLKYLLPRVPVEGGRAGTGL